MKPEYADITKLKSPGQCLSWWLVHSCLYYEMGYNVITDDEWVTLGKWVQASWDELRHPHKHLVDITCITSTAHYIQFPTIVRNTAFMIYKWDQTRLQRNKKKKLIRR